VKHKLEEEEARKNHKNKHFFFDKKGEGGKKY